LFEAGMSRSNHGAAGHVVERRIRFAALTWAAFGGTTLLACTTTLDPSVLVGEEEDAGASGGEPLAPCTLFTSGGAEYLFCPGRLGYSAAAADCALRNATLGAVGSRAEEDFFVATAMPIVADDWWLGGSRDDAFVWRWRDGSVFWRGGPEGMPEAGAFVDWKAGEPNNASTTLPEPERCLALTVTGDWNDRACVLLLPYLCERAPGGP
jgi:hypothetical protein